MLHSASPRITKMRCHARLVQGSAIHCLTEVVTPPFKRKDLWHGWATNPACLGRRFLGDRRASCAGWNSSFRASFRVPESASCKPDASSGIFRSSEHESRHYSLVLKTLARDRQADAARVGTARFASSCGKAHFCASPHTVRQTRFLL